MSHLRWKNQTAQGFRVGGIFHDDDDTVDEQYQEYLRTGVVKGKSAVQKGQNIPSLNPLQFDRAQAYQLDDLSFPMLNYAMRE